MHLLRDMADAGFEQVVHCHDESSGLRAIIAIHSTVLGPGLGGTRCLPYPTEEAALADVLRLARGMTYKAAAAGLDMGGGKAVIIGDPATIKSEALLRAYGRFIDSLGGRYFTAEDVGTTQSDMDMIRRETPFVTGCSLNLGGSSDPSQATAIGVGHAIRAVVDVLGLPLAGLRVVISGVGKVGSSLARGLVAEGATVTVADVDATRTDAIRAELGAAVGVVAPEEAHRTPCDVFSPCALGGILNAASIAELQTQAVVGAANNQLAEPGDAKCLNDRGILYAPDFIVNAGGIINIAEELSPRGYDIARALARVAEVGNTTRRVLDLASTRKIPTAQAADELAENRMAQLRGIRAIRTFKRP